MRLPAQYYSSAGTKRIARLSSLRGWCGGEPVAYEPPWRVARDEGETASASTAPCSLSAGFAIGSTRGIGDQVWLAPGFSALREYQSLSGNLPAVKLVTAPVRRRWRYRDQGGSTYGPGHACDAMRAAPRGTALVDALGAATLTASCSSRGERPAAARQCA